jgi:hypothetical protein
MTPGVGSKQRLEEVMVCDSKPWLKSYDAHVEGEIAIPDVSLKDALLWTFREYADLAAVHYIGMTMSYGELLEGIPLTSVGKVDKKAMRQKP